MHRDQPLCKFRCAGYDQECRGNRSAGLWSQGLGFPNDPVSQFGPKRQSINHFNSATQQLLQALREADVVTQAIVQLKVNEKVDVAARLQAAAQKRSKYGDLAYAMLSGKRHYLVALLTKVIKGVDGFYSHLR